ncbi:hypothetical protein SAMN05421781_0034, partial [Marinococcus luteus]
MSHYNLSKHYIGFFERMNNDSISIDELKKQGLSAWRNKDVLKNGMNSFKSSNVLWEAGTPAINHDGVGKAMESFRKAQPLREAGISAVNRDAVGKAMES